MQQNAAEERSRRTDKATGRSTLEKVTQLEQRVLLLERERSSQLYSRRHEFRKVFCALEEAELKLNQLRKTEKKELGQQISRIRCSVQAFQKMLTDMKPGPVFMEKLRQVLEETEASVLAFKDRQRNVYESLLVEERQASQEVMAFHRRMEAWAGSSGSAAERTAAAASVSGGRGEGATAMPPAVLAFERFLQQTGGPRGGWDEYDHNTFLHIRNRFPGESGFMEAALRELPTRTEADIQAHSNWHTEHCTLLEAKKLSIQQWRESKELAHSEQIKVAAGKEVGEEDKRRRATAEKERQEKERQQNKEKLHSWKVQQQLKKREAEEQRQRVEEELVEKMERETMRQAELRLQVKSYQESKERERQVVMAAEQVRRAEERELQIVATREIEKFRERDLRAVAEKRERMEEKELEKIKQKKRLDKLKEQVVVSVSRDPDRLLRPTAGWEERRKAMREEEEEGVGRLAGVGVSSRQLPKRAVPAWRQGL